MNFFHNGPVTNLFVGVDIWASAITLFGLLFRAQGRWLDAQFPGGPPVDELSRAGSIKRLAGWWRVVAVMTPLALAAFVVGI
jgi:hypothetical protein